MSKVERYNRAKSKHLYFPYLQEKIYIIMEIIIIFLKKYKKIILIQIVTIQKKLFQNKKRNILKLSFQIMIFIKQTIITKEIFKIIILMNLIIIIQIVKNIKEISIDITKL